MATRRIFLLLSLYAFLFLSACSTAPKNDSPFPKEYSTPDSPCFKAVIQNHLEGIQKYSAICLKSKNANGVTPLMLASAKGYSAIVDYLVQIGLDPNDADQSGDTSLNYAVVFNQVDVAQLLILNRASLDTKKPEGITAFMMAVQRGSPQMIWALGQHPDGINQKAEDGWTALYFAIRRQDENVLKFLLERGACPNTIDSYKQTPLDFAKEIQWAQGIKILKKARPCSGVKP